jgi:hypothetical protein
VVKQGSGADRIGSGAVEVEVLPLEGGRGIVGGDHRP